MKTPKPDHSTEELRRAHIQLSTLGASQQHKDALVKLLLETCEDPRQWPLTDAERVELLRKSYDIARRARTAFELERRLALRPNPSTKTEVRK